MSGVVVTQLPTGGFNFDLCKRNEGLRRSGVTFPKPVKTGTTIAGCVFKDGVVLGADTRATEGTVVADKNCEKIHFIAKNIFCCGAGTAADTEFTTNFISAQIELHKLTTGRAPRVATALKMLKQYLYRYSGQIGAYLVLGGYDITGPSLFTVHAHGSTDKLPYVSMGSGSLAAMATFEDQYKPNMERDEAMTLVRNAITAGILNDLGSGSNVDLCVVTADKTDYLRGYEEIVAKGPRTGDYRYRQGTTAIIGTPCVRRFEVVSQSVSSVESMETCC
ncbi:proteasome subunit beta type-7-like [Halichondria panicea]|uniref:proteasome subunit beta type-7-like n=1 Tax=Halichondria panicea TaxID=6063 RepID=UPI00312B9B96